jgi:hypothetical protein
MGIGCCSCSKNDLKKSIFIDDFNGNQNKPEKPIQNIGLNKGGNNNNDIEFFEEYKYPTQRSINRINDKYKKNNNIKWSKKSEENNYNSNNKYIIYEEEGIIDSLIRTQNF